MLLMDARSELASILRGAADAAVDAGLPVLTHEDTPTRRSRQGGGHHPRPLLDHSALIDQTPVGCLVGTPRRPGDAQDDPDRQGHQR